MHLTPRFGTTHSLGAVARDLLAAIVVLIWVPLTIATGAPSFASSPSPSPQPTASASPGASPSPGASGSNGTVTFGIGPGLIAGTEERPYFSFGATPGAQTTDHVLLVNYALFPLTLAVYPVQADNTVDGSIGFLNVDQQPVDVAAWLSVGTTRPLLVQVPGRPTSTSQPGEVSLPMKLQVPTNAQPGDHVGGIVAALVVKSSGSGEHVTLEQRVVTRVYVRVSGPLHPELRVVGLHAVFHSKDATVGAGSVTMTYTVRNTGNVRLAVSQAAQVSGLLGASKKVHPADIEQLLPGGSSKVSVVITKVSPAIRLTAHVALTPAALPGDVDPVLTSVSASTGVWAVPWALVIVLVLVAVLEWQRRRRRKRRRLVSVPAGAAAATSVPARVAAPETSGRHRDSVGSTRRSRHAR
jgi:hypothetical protein